MKSLTSIAYKTLTALMIVSMALTAVPATPAYAVTDTFNTPGTTTWTAPAGVTSVTVEVWGGGGKGGDRTSNGGGGGGGGGAYSQKLNIPVVPGNNYTVFVGAGATTTAAGGNSYFINAATVLAVGGTSVADNNTAGAAGGAAAAGVGDTKYSGGTGANAPGAGGGGGSSAGTGANGGNGTGSTGGIAPAGGGAGGAGRTGSQGDGTNGTAPGGGGGGAYRTSFGTRNGGDGAAGRVQITYTIPTFTITVTQGANGTITPGTTSLTIGGSQAFDIAPNDGFVVGDVVVGPPSTSAGRTNSFTFSNVQSNKTITASFESGWRWPATFTDSGGTAWGTQNGGYHSENSRATSPYFFLIPLSGSIDYGTFNIPAIPANSTIDGIEVALEGTTTASNISVSLFNGVAFGASVQTNFVPNNSEETQILGGPNFKWGSTWTTDSFTNANFRVRLAAGQNAGFSADQVQVKVYYTLPPLTVTINQKITAPAQADPTNTSPINFTVVFSQPVSNFATGDVIFTNSTVGGTLLGTVTPVTPPGGATTYNVAVSGMTGSGTVIAWINPGVASDANGTLNDLSTFTDHSVYYDATPPTATIVLQSASDTGISNTDDLTNADSPVFDVTFSEAVSVLENTDFSNAGTATGCAFAVGAPTGNTYPVTVSSCSEGTLILRLGASAVTDNVTNPNAQTDGATVTIDRTRTTVTVDKTAGQPDPTNLSPINFTAVFSEPVYDFADADVALSGTATSGATIATVAQVNPPNDGTTWELSVSNMATVGLVTANINDGVAMDAAGNGNFASTSPIPMDNTVQYDTAAPIATIDLQPASDSGIFTNDNITNVPSPVFNVGFNKMVTGLASGDFTNGGTATGCVFVVGGSGTTYTVTASGCSEGTLQLQLAADAVRDTANNPNTQTTGPEVTLDRTGPTVTIEQAAGQSDPTNTGPIHFAVDFSETVYNFATGDVVFTGSTVGGTLLGAVTPVITPPNGATTYNVAVSGMTSDGDVIASINANVATDVAGNNNMVSTSIDHTVTYDTFRPTVTINQKTTAPVQADPTNASPINFTVIFTEPVTGFGSEDVSLSGLAGATIAVVTGSGTTYNVAVSGMVDDGQVIATVLAGGARDEAGNTNTASTSTDNIVIYDTLRPTVTIDQAIAQADPTNASPINFTVVFSEPVTGFTSSDVKLIGTAGATTASITPISTTTYTVAVSGMTQSGTVIASILVNSAQDFAGNNSYVSTSGDNTVYFDNSSPTVTIEQGAAQADPTGTSPINFAVVFSESMNSATFTSDDIVLSGTAGATTVTITGSGSTYNVVVSGMTQSGTVIAQVKAGSVQDLAGNSNAVSTSVDNTVTYDITRPSVTVNQAAGQADPTNGTPINFTVVFSEAVTGFTSVSTAGSTAPGTLVATISGGPSNYNVAIDGMTGPGTVVVTIPANAATDPSGNGNTASSSTDNTVTFDNVRPTVTINQAVGQSDPTGASPINFDVIFSEPVSGFTFTDITLSGTAGADTVVITGGGAIYTVSVSGMTNAGTVIAQVNVGGAADTAGNTNTASSSTDNIVTFDNNVFSVAVTQAIGQADPTNTGPIHFTAVFNKPIISAGDFTASDVLVSGTAGGTKTVTVTEIAPNDRTTYDISISGMTTSGTVIVTIPAGGVHDAAGNGNANSTNNDNIVTYDITVPTVTINQASGQADPTNIGPINFTVVFSEPVTGFATGDVLFTGSTAGGTLIGAVSEIAPNNGTTYNVAVTGMTTSGTVIASIAAGVATDAAGNNNAASSSTDNVVTYDVVALTVTINQKTSAPAQADPTRNSPIIFTVVFSKSVTDFATGDVTLAGTAGATTAAVSGSGANYTVTVTGMAQTGTVIATIAADVATDASGNPNVDSTSTDNSVLYDITLPTVTINQAAGQADPTRVGPINFTVVFSERVSGFATGDVTFSGTAGGTLIGTVTEIAPNDGTTYRVAVTGMTSSGTVIVTVPANAAQDTAGNGNANSTSTDNTVTYDITVPTVTINQAVGQPDPTNTAPINFTVVFSERMSGFATGDVLFTGSTAGGTLIGTVTEIAPNDGTTYNVAVTGMTTSGTVVASIAGGMATDTAGNGNAVSTSTDNTVTYDVSAFSVTINRAGTQDDPTNTGPIIFTVVFNKDVADFATGDVTLGGTAGATTAIVSGGPNTYTVTVTGMTQSGTVTAIITAGKAHDASGNPNTASTSTDNSVLYDITLPTVTINQAAGQADPTNTGPIVFTVTFSEPVFGFTSDGVVLSGTAGGVKTVAVSGSGTTYTVEVSGMAGYGTVIATVPANAAYDAAGNGNANSTSSDNIVTYDSIVPTVTINQAAGQPDPTNASPIDFTVVFSERVSGFATGDVLFTGSSAGGTLIGTVTEVAPNNGTTYNVAVTGMTSGGTVVASLLAGVATDTAGNTNTASSSTDNTVTFDNAALTVTINQAAGQADPTNVRPINFTVVFSKPVTGFANADVVLIAPAGATATVSGASGGTTYNVAVTGMTTSGAVIASIQAGAAQDSSGTSSAASTSTDNSVIYDVTLPTVTINQAAGQADPTNTGPINFTVVFSEPVTGFAAADVTLSGAPGTLAATVTLVSGNTYTVAVSGMTGSGTVVATIAAGGIQDLAGNNNTNSTSTDNAVTYDVTPPTVTINQAAGQADPTNASPIDFTVVFSEPVFGFATGEVTLGGTATGPITATVSLVSGTTYNVAVSGMTGSGTVTASLLAGVAADTAGNTNTASSSTDNTVTYDNNVPAVTITPAAGQADPTNASPINFTVVFSKPVTGFVSGEVNLSGSAGATTSVVSGSGTTYNVAISGMTNSGLVVATVPANVATDASGNANPASTNLNNSVIYDITAPTVTINQAAGQVDPTNASPINFTVVFSESVTGFTGTDVNLTGGSAPGIKTATVTGNGTTYNVAVTGMTGTGTVIATVAAGNAQDAAGNSNTNSTSTDNSVVYDSIAPSVTINQAVGQTDPTNASPIIFAVVFSKPVTGFTGADVTVGGSALATTVVVTGAGTNYTVAVSGMTSDGTVTVSIAAGVAADAVGNTNTASTSTDNTVSYGLTVPTVTINQAAGQVDPTNTSPINFTVIFSKPVTGFTGTDVTVGGTTLGTKTAVVTGIGTTYNVAVSGMTSSGTVIATIPAGVAQDTTGNANTASNSTDNLVAYDITSPTVTINQAVGQVDPSNIAPINFTVIFSEPVTGFTGADVALSGTAFATTATVTGSGTTYTVAVSGMTASGTVIASIPAGNVQDSAGNGNADSTSVDNSVSYDSTAPSVTINQAAGQADPTNVSPIHFTVEFSKPVTGFTGADVTLSSGTATVSGGPTVYDISVAGMSQGILTASVPAGGATDAVGNTNNASTSTDNTVMYDTTGPTVTINQAAAQLDPTGVSPINFTVVFSEPVTGFALADLNLGGTAGATTMVLSGSGATYNVAVSGMASSGTVFVTITDAAASDAAGNLSAASTSTDNSVRYDTGAPTVTINQAASQADPTNTSPISFTVIFSKPVTGFTNADVNVTGTAGATTVVVSGGGTTYTVEVNGMADTGTVTATIPADRAQDSAGNGNIASTSTDNTVLYDITDPTVTINQAVGQADPTNASTINFIVVFSEPVIGFTTADITLGGTAGPTTVVVTGSGPTYNVAVIGMVTDGTVTATISAGVVTDATGNPNTAGTSTDNEVTYNTTRPTVTVEQAVGQADPTNTSPINFTVVFSELVNGFTDSDLVIGGTAGANLAVISGTGPTYSVVVSGMTNDGTVTLSIPAGAVTDPSNNGNLASTSSDNIVTYLDGIGPNVRVINTNPPTPNQVLSNTEQVTFNITQFTVKFNQDVYNPAGDSDADDVTNPNNYMLIRELGDTAGLQTVSCIGGAVTPADARIAIDAVTYDNATYTATFTFNGGQPLANGYYYLFVCGTTSIVDPLNNALALVGSSGLPGTDFRTSFSVRVTNDDGSGGNNNGGNNNNTGQSTTNGLIIPVTGFKQGEVTVLPKQPAAMAYAATDLWLEIPKLKLKMTIVGVPQTKSGWDISWLGRNAGWLNGSAFPTWKGNSVITAHVWDELNKPGPFVGLINLQYGDQVIVHAFGYAYTYEVTGSSLILPTNTSAAFKHEDKSWLTLITCEDYKEATQTYKSRRMVRALLVSVTKEK